MAAGNAFRWLMVCAEKWVPVSMKDRAEVDSEPPGKIAVPGGDKTLMKGLMLIETMCRSSASRGVSDLASELSLTKSNVHRLLQTLITAGFVAKEADGDRYELTSKLWRLSREPRSYDALLALVHPLLGQLVAETGETATFVIIEGNNVITMDQVETPHTVRVYYRVGDSQRLDQVMRGGRGISAIQQIAFAFRPEVWARSALEKIRGELGRPLAFVDEQLARIEAVRRDGYAIVRGEWMEGVNAVGAAVKGEAGKLIGIVISFGPEQRLTGRDLNRVRDLTSGMAARLAERLANDGPLRIDG
ncbi:IclR family transcriptional regulator [Bosea sp. NPDC003192]|uniref:IclR family transcriptional regulator n=1 Tax=Bosea sp. NPDC003192 TaxID=3390551 RepID=UPI003D09325A